MRTKYRAGQRHACAAFVLAAAAWAPTTWGVTKTWDLDSAGHNNGQINNGGGIWSKQAADANWTTDGGATNTNFNDGDDVIFGGNPGVGAAGTITLSGIRDVGTMTFNAPASGSFTIAGGGSDSLSLSAASTGITQSSSTAVTIAVPVQGSDTTLTLGGLGTGIVTISGALTEKSSHPMALTKTGSSNFVLTSASSSYTGVTTISGGTFTVNGTLGGGGTVNVNGPAKLAGTGTISKSVNINSGATLSPKDSGTNANVGALSTNNQTWAGGSTYEWEISNATTAAGTGYDTVNVNGTLSIGATSGNKMTIKLISHGAVTGWNRNSVWHWTIGTATNNIAALAGNFQLDTSDFLDDNAGDVNSFQVDLDATSKQIRVSYVPEPGSTLLLGGMTAVGALTRRRRHKI
jgi:fibronectin-binding autotransporter adhesin